MEWVSRIIAIALEMVLPGVMGGWLDKKFGTGFISLTGFALGISIAIWHLTLLGKQKIGADASNHSSNSKRPHTPENRSSSESPSSDES
ncbi:MAG TPA: AtpZ/AtpI family protein, partial [Pirellulales bacterium]|nr:AtpZ/AtpI family protein [Pirellulales bacterium]